MKSIRSIKKEQRKNHKIAVMAILLCMWLAGVSIPVRAEEKGAEIQIPVIMQGTEGTIVLKAEETDAPLPEQTELTVKKGGQAKFGPIRYDQPGDYHYRIYQRTGKEENVTYDASAHLVTVRVTNGDHGQLEACLWCQKEGNENKLDSITFSNKRVEKTVETKPEIRKSVVYGRKTVKTGDVAPVAVLAAISGISAGTLAAVERWKRKNER